MKDCQVRYGLVCNDSGGILDDVLVYRWPYGCAVVVNAAQPREDRRAGWTQHTAGLDVQIQDQTARHDDDRGAGAEGGRAGRRDVRGRRDRR